MCRCLTARAPKIRGTAFERLSTIRLLPRSARREHTWSPYLLAAAFRLRFQRENHWHIRCGGDREHCFAATGARQFLGKQTFFLFFSPLFSVRRAFSQELFG